MTSALTHLERLEAGSIHILREAVAEAVGRDVKGRYEEARAGRVETFTGIDTTGLTPNEAANLIVARLVP